MGDIFSCLMFLISSYYEVGVFETTSEHIPGGPQDTTRVCATNSNLYFGCFVMELICFDG